MYLFFVIQREFWTWFIFMLYAPCLHIHGDWLKDILNRYFMWTLVHFITHVYQYRNNSMFLVDNKTIEG